MSTPDYLVMLETGEEEVLEGFRRRAMKFEAKWMRREGDTIVKECIRVQEIRERGRRQEERRICLKEIGWTQEEY